MIKKLAIFNPSIGAGLGKNVFGKDVANHDLFRSLLLYGGLDDITFLNPSAVPADKIRTSLIQDRACTTKVNSTGIMSVRPAIESGTLLRGTADLINLAWHRREHAAVSNYSLMGLIHTTAPASIRNYIGETLIAPIMPWDALICTSPSVQSAMQTMFDEWHDYLAARFGGTTRTAPLLPLIPLGVEAQNFAQNKTTKVGGAQLRMKLGVGEDDMLVLWVGRLSFFEKAFPQPMFLAVEAAARLSGKKVHFAMAGWFPDGAAGEKMYREAAALQAPSVKLHMIDGNDKATLRQAWAGADVFISLVDNIQETFGITPIEAMASGLPVVVSDWDGYNYTVRDGIDGFLIPTLIGSASSQTADLITQHNFGLKTYQQYVGVVAQHTAVNIKIAAARLADLFASKHLRETMGAAGQKRVAETFDWKIVAPQYVELANHLAEVRQSIVAASPVCRPLASGQHPLKRDPFVAFAGFATHILTPTSVLTLAPDFDDAAFERATKIPLNAFAANWRANATETKALLESLKSSGPTPFQHLCAQFPAARHEPVKLTCLWLAKLGYIDWL